MNNASREAPECRDCGQISSEDCLTLNDCKGYFLCDDCYEFRGKRMGDTLTREEVYYLARWLSDHRRKAFITCEETCECWEVSEKIEKALEILETN